MTYYGLSIAADQLAAGGLFTNFLLSMSMDFPATALVLLLLDRWGRRRLQTVTMVVSGVACLLGVLTTMVAPAGRSSELIGDVKRKITVGVVRCCQSSGEIKRIEVKLDSHEELDNHLRVQARSRGGRWSWTLKRAQQR